MYLFGLEFNIRFKVSCNSGLSDGGAERTRQSCPEDSVRGTSTIAQAAVLFGRGVYRGCAPCSARTPERGATAQAGGGKGGVGGGHPPRPPGAEGYEREAAAAPLYGPQNAAAAAGSERQRAGAAAWAQGFAGGKNRTSVASSGFFSPGREAPLRLCRRNSQPGGDEHRLTGSSEGCGA